MINRIQCALLLFVSVNVITMSAMFTIDWQNDEIKFKLQRNKITQKALVFNHSCNSVFTSIVLPSEQCVSIFKSTTSKRILCCSERNNSNISGSCIYFHRKIDNAVQPF